MEDYTAVGATSEDDSAKTECSDDFEVVPDDAAPAHAEDGWIVHGQPHARSSCSCGSGKKYKRCCATPELKKSWKKHSRSRRKPRTVSAEDVARIDTMLGRSGYLQSTRRFVSAGRKVSGRAAVRYTNAAALVAASNARSRNDVEKCAVAGWIKVKSQNLWFSVDCERCGQYDTATTCPEKDAIACRACRNFMAYNSF